MPSEPSGGESPTLRRNLLASLADATCFSLMVGLGETYFSAYILALRGSEIASGLVIALPLLAGAILQLATPWAVRQLNSHKRWVVGTAMVQATSLLLMPLSALCGDWSVPLAFAAVTLYWAAGLATGPAWNTWIEGVVPRRLRTRFFSRRVRFGQAAILVGFIVGGILLQHGKITGRTLIWFTVVLWISAACRFASAWLLSRQSECPTQRVAERYVTIKQLLAGRSTSSGGRLLTYLFAVQVAVYIAGPYFAPFMLSHMEMTYRDFALLTGLTFIGKVLALPVWGQVAHRAGARRLLWIGGVSIVPIAGLWVVSRSYAFLAVLQILGGVTWAAYELALFLMFFETIPRAERTSVLTVYNLGNSLAQVVGALLGAAWLKYFGRTYDVYLWLFVASSIARGMTVLLLPQVGAPRRATQPTPAVATVIPDGVVAKTTEAPEPNPALLAESQAT